MVEGNELSALLLCFSLSLLLKRERCRDVERESVFISEFLYF